MELIVIDGMVEVVQMGRSNNKGGSHFGDSYLGDKQYRTYRKKPIRFWGCSKFAVGNNS